MLLQLALNLTQIIIFWWPTQNIVYISITIIYDGMHFGDLFFTYLQVNDYLGWFLHSWIFNRTHSIWCNTSGNMFLMLGVDMCVCVCLQCKMKEFENVKQHLIINLFLVWTEVASSLIPPNYSCNTLESQWENMSEKHSKTTGCVIGSENRCPLDSIV